MKQYPILILFTLMTTFSSYCQDNLKNFNDANRSYKHEDIIEVSIIQLISNPEKYDGKIISIDGYVKLQFEGNAIYFHEEDYRRRIYKNSIWLNLSPENSIGLRERCSDKYCYIIGEFIANQKGHFGMFSGSIALKGIFPRE